MENFHYKRLPFVNVANVRDLGGYPLEEGHATRYGMFFRSGRLFNANKSEIDYLKKLGVKSIIDLRFTNEFIEQPDSCWLDPHFTIHNISLFGEMALSQLAVQPGDMDPLALVRLYIQIAEECSTQVLKVIRTIANATEGAVLYHCVVGKDRTGIITMFLQSIAGVDRMDIIAEYEVSHTFIKTFSDDQSGSHWRNMELFLEYLDTHFGSPVQYLRHIGVSESELAEIRNRLVN
jgi:protein-tyrosine phosphatase